MQGWLENKTIQENVLIPYEREGASSKIYSLTVHMEQNILKLYGK